MSQSDTTANRQIARAAGTVMFAIVLGQIASLIRSVLVAQAFPSFELDAFFSANRVSETLFTLIAAGALGSAFLPTFTGLLAKEERAYAWKLASALINLVTLILSVAALIASVFAPQIVRYLLAPGLSDNPEAFALTVDLLRIQSVSAVLFGIGGLVMSILNAHQVFFIPQITAAMYQLGQIFGVLVLSRWIGIYGLAWGVVIGAGLFLLVQVPSLLKLNGKFSFSLGLGNTYVVKVFQLMGPRVFGAAIVQLNFWVNNNLGSRMAEGSIQSLAYAFTLMVMAQAAIAQSVAIAAMPTFSAQHALGKLDEMRASLASALRGILFLAVPASAGLMLLGRPIVSMLYERGEFNATIAAMTAWALLWFAAGLVGHSIMEVLTRAFYAQQDTKTPVIIGVIAMGLNVFFSITLSRYFASIGWYPLGGLALANSLATALEAIALFVMMRRRLSGIEGRHILRGAIPALAAAAFMSLVLWGWLNIGAGLNPWILAPVGVGLGGMVYFGILFILRVPELSTIANGILRRLKR